MRFTLPRSLLSLTAALIFCVSILLASGCASSPSGPDETTAVPDTVPSEDTTGSEDTAELPVVPVSRSMEEELLALYDVRPAVTQLPEYEEALSDPRIHAIFYEGIDYQDHPTKIFALIAYPEEAAEDSRVPAVVINPWLGGSPDPDTIRVWLDHGYAVLMMENQDAVIPGTGVFFEWTGYDQDEFHHCYDDFDGDAEPYEDQWLYYAISDAILANNILRNDPKIDPDRIGISGISMGAVVTVAAATYDSRFAFAVPCAGGAYLQENRGNACIRHQVSPGYAAYWDASSRLDQIRCPVLYVSGAKDPYFTCNSVAHTARETKEGTLCLQYFLPHDQSVVRNAPEIFRFADHIVKGTPEALCAFTEQSYDPVKNRVSFSFTVPEDLTLTSVEICYSKTALGTPEEYRSRPSLWDHKPLEIREDRTYFFEVPDGAALFYIQVTCSTSADGDGKTAEILSSSDLYILKETRE